MKSPKTYRFSPTTMYNLEKLKKYSENWTGRWYETDIVEHAINCLYAEVEKRKNHEPV